MFAPRVKLLTGKVTGGSIQQSGKGLVLNTFRLRKGPSQYNDMDYKGITRIPTSIHITTSSPGVQSFTRRAAMAPTSPMRSAAGGWTQAQAGVIETREPRMPFTT